MEDPRFGVDVASPSSNRSDAYSIGRVVHVGPRSILYLATRKADGETVIVKTLPEEHRPSDTERIRNEFNVCSRLDVPGVMQPLELWQYQGRPAVVLGYFEGHSLDKEMKPMAVDAFLAIAPRIAEILASIHGKKVVHKDIKPDNILFSPRTGEVRIADFGISSLWASQRPRREGGWIEGSLPYMAPEQTGRIDRAVDQRSDLYSLGVTYFELLTGTYPFEARDPLEWAHCHIARIPPSPRERAHAVPEMIAAVVLKLLAKDPEDRYQSAQGLRLDLEECRAQWREKKSIDAFPLGRKDFSEDLRIPRRLYGREAETALLNDGLHRAATGRGPECTMVSGYSGIGKSSLVEVLRRNSIVAQGMFVAGKFDQYHRDIPYATLVEAFSNAVLQILAGGAERISDLKSRLQSTLGVNGRLMIEVIPLLESILEGQPPVPDLSPGEAKNRFRLVFGQFISVFAQHDHPLVIFLDDMQWSDSASLELVMDLIRNRDLKQLYVVGAYRDNEVGPSHPLTIAMEEAKKNGTEIRKLVLSPLSERHLLALLTDTLRPASGDLAQLTRLLQEKTGGNPFFAIQFLLSLNEEGLVRPGPDGAWTWDIDAIRAKGATENVIELMAKRLHRLSPAARETLQHFACLGARAETGDMARILDVTGEEECHELLRETMDAGMVLAAAGSYAFLHDRVQEAAYSSIAEADRPERHLRIGRRLLRDRSPQEIEEKVFLIVSQLNRGIRLIKEETEKEELLRLDSLAGRKAKASIAYDAARTCLTHALSLLPEGAWKKRYRECFSLHFDLSECEFLLGNFDRAEELALLLLDQADSLSDRAAVFSLRIRCYLFSGKTEKSFNLSLEALRLFGIDWPEGMDEIMGLVGKEMGEVQALMKDRSIESIVDAPVCGDAEKKQLISLLVGILPITFFIKPALYPVAVLEAMIQSLRHGNVADTCIAYCCYGALIPDDIDTGYRFSEMSRRLNEKLGDVKSQGAVLMLHCVAHNHRKRPFTTSFPLFERGYMVSLETGDLLHASYNAWQHVVQTLDAGVPFDQVLQLTGRYLESTRLTHNRVVELTLTIHEHFILALQGKTKGPMSFEEGGFEEKETLEFLGKAGFAPGMAYFHILKQVLAVINGQFEEALAHSELAKGPLIAVRMTPPENTHFLYRALAMAGLCARATEEKRAEYLKEIDEKIVLFARYAQSCPENYAGRHLLLCAEKARIEGKDLEAMRLFEEALGAAELGGLLLDQAVIQEAAHRFFAERNLKRQSDLHLYEARSAYRRLGAIGKVKLIDLHHPHLRNERHVTRDTSYEADTRQLDILSVAKASQAISGEVLLDSLLRKMMGAMLEQAGAQRGCMLLRKHDKYVIAAEAFLGEAGAIRVALQAGETEPARSLPQTVLDVVARTKKRIILENAGNAPVYSLDPYIASARPKSVLCLPILRQGEPSGLLYLENNLLTGAFTADKLEVLELMASQAAISLENAGLYEGLRREYSERKQVEEQLRQSQKMDALGTLAAGIAHDFNNLLNVINGYSEMALMRLDADHPIFDSLGEILKSGERAAGLTRQLLAYSRKQGPSPKLWNLNEIVRDSESLLKRLIGESVTMTSILGPEVGKVRADRGQVEQILMNLVVNARDAMPGGGKLTVETANEELGADFCAGHPGMAPGPFVMLSVRDTGMGMPTEVREKVFEPFFTTKEVGKGTGLGLAVVQGIVTQSGGGIDLDSEPGKGTTFRIYLPRVDTPPAEDEDQGFADMAEPGPGGGTILLVEDEEAVRKFTSQALESQGFRVIVCPNGKEALSLLEEGSLAVDLLITDVVMPEMGGRELAQRMRRARPKLPILMVSGYADQPDSPDALRGERLLRKPFAVSELINQVRDLMRAS